MESFYKNDTWELVKAPRGKKIIGCKWVFKMKEDTTWVEEARYKAWLVAKGYNEIQDIDFRYSFSLVGNHNYIHVLFSLVVMNDLVLEQLDVKTVFLHDEIEERSTCKSQRISKLKEKKIMFTCLRNSCIA